MASLLRPALPSCLPSLLLLLQLPCSSAGQFRVIGPAHPIRALVGDEAELPCRIYPGKNATGMEVGWYRPPFSRVVHLYRNGKDHDAEQAPEYRGRTELLKETMGEGKVTLRIRNVRFSDEGGFTCFFRDHSYQEEAAMELRVEDHRGPRLPLPAAQTERKTSSRDREPAPDVWKPLLSDAASWQRWRTAWLVQAPTLRVWHPPRCALTGLLTTRTSNLHFQECSGFQMGPSPLRHLPFLFPVWLPTSVLSPRSIWKPPLAVARQVSLSLTRHLCWTVTEAGLRPAASLL
ncbi:myelin-oligodendrocyte glycoprotein isoform X1 [Callorhinus ursinus]|uniref:myelin-oligodendrocyte glycoprotein isoform X1 n=1 Tax=Callorhinus ursinus TaxID=34884 RepID=UPI003CD00EE1